MIDFDGEMAQCAADIELALDVQLRAATLSRPGLAPERLISAMRHGALNGGKRLRPLLVRQASDLFGVAAADSLPTGMAVEMVHCYSLIHDDLPAMDDDDLRRGRPTVHKAYDEATAILAGDALLTQAFLVLAGANASADVWIKLVAELALGAGPSGMVGGQMRDIEGEVDPLDDAGIAQMQAMKTGALIRAAVRMGAILGRASESDLDHLTRYGELAGRAFQLADDLLDVTASSATMGKATGKDTGAGKQTLVARIGEAEARRHLVHLVESAQDALGPFGTKADGLRATARYFASREH